MPLLPPAPAPGQGGQEEGAPLPAAAAQQGVARRAGQGRGVGSCPPCPALLHCPPPLAALLTERPELQHLEFSTAANSVIVPQVSRYLWWGGGGGWAIPPLQALPAAAAGSHALHLSALTLLSLVPQVTICKAAGFPFLTSSMRVCPSPASHCSPHPPALPAWLCDTATTQAAHSYAVLLPLAISAQRACSPAPGSARHRPVPCPSPPPRHAAAARAASCGLAAWSRLWSPAPTASRRPAHPTAGRVWQHVDMGHGPVPPPAILILREPCHTRQDHLGRVQAGAAGAGPPAWAGTPATAHVPNCRWTAQPFASVKSQASAKACAAATVILQWCGRVLGEGGWRVEAPGHGPCQRAAIPAQLWGGQGGRAPVT